MDLALDRITDAAPAVDSRHLPSHSAGTIDVPWVASTFDEIVERDTEWGPHSHSHHELLWNEQGASTVGVGNRVWTITPVLGVWMPAGTVHSATAAAGTWYRTTHFATPRVDPLTDGVAVVEITPLLRLLLTRLADVSLSTHSRTTTEAMVLDVLAPAPREITVSMPSSALLAPIVRAHQDDPAESRSLDDWAATVGASARTITRAFQAETGLGFARWSAAVRVQHAVYLLGAGATPEDVATTVGYSTVSAFGAAFKRVTGTTPGAFRHVRSAI